MTAIGGFLPLEVPAALVAEPYHAEAVALASGRACWHVVLRVSRPRRVLIPFFVCDAVLQPLAATGTAFEFYAIDRSFRPVAAALEPNDGDLILIVNYFGVLTSFVGDCVRRQPSRVAVDDTQAFFRCGTSAAWSFNSARKFFGVPDGAFLYGPAHGIGDLPPSDVADCDHLLTRLAGDDGEAWEQFKRHEARIGIEPRAMSAISTRLLAAVDMARARRQREQNFNTLHARLGTLNTIALPLGEIDGDGPMCYPFLPAVDVDRRALNRLGIFVPTFWPEIDARAERGFEWERHVARRLLPLPVDHRYGREAMDTLAHSILQVLR
jgi:hypothetical protein